MKRVLLALLLPLMLCAPAIAGIEDWKVTEANKSHKVTTAGDIQVENKGSNDVVVKVLNSDGSLHSQTTIKATETEDISVPAGKTAWIVHHAGNTDGCVMTQ